MLTFLLAGLVVGFALGWGTYWYLQQTGQDEWNIDIISIVGMVRGHPFWDELSERVGEPTQIVEGELLTRTRRILEQDTPSRTVNKRRSRTVQPAEHATEKKNTSKQDPAAKRKQKKPQQSKPKSPERQTVDHEPRQAEPAKPKPAEQKSPEPTPAEQKPTEAEQTPSSQSSIYDDATIAYCLKCQRRRPIHDEERTQTRTGRIAVRGICGVCGNELFTFVQGKT